MINCLCLYYLTNFTTLRQNQVKIFACFLEELKTRIVFEIFLPLKFDSTPRSRSQSVELPEFGPMGLGLPAMMNLSGHPIHHHQKGSKNRKMSLNSTSAGPPDAVHVMVQPPSPVFGNMGCEVSKGGNNIR